MKRLIYNLVLGILMYSPILQGMQKTFMGSKKNLNTLFKLNILNKKCFFSSGKDIFADLCESIKRLDEPKVQEYVRLILLEKIKNQEISCTEKDLGDNILRILGGTGCFSENEMCIEKSAVYYMSLLKPVEQE